MTEKEKFLIEHGYFEKEYTDCKHYNPEYPEFEYDKETGEGKRFRYVAIDMSDSEYIKLKAKFKKDENPTPSINNTNSNSPAANNQSQNNIVSSVLKYIALFTYACGIISGLIFLATEIVLGVALIVSGFISGSIFLGFSEIIRLLHEINKKADK